MVVKDLKLIKGDTFSFELYLPVDTFVNVTGIYFTMKRKGTDAVNIFQESIGDGVESIAAGTWRVKVSPKETKNVPAGTYDYDLCVCSDADVYTILIGKIHLKQDVTRESV